MLFTGLEVRTAQRCIRTFETWNRYYDGVYEGWTAMGHCPCPENHCLVTSGLKTNCVVDSTKCTDSMQLWLVVLKLSKARGKCLQIVHTRTIQEHLTMNLNLCIECGRIHRVKIREILYTSISSGSRSTSTADAPLTSNLLLFSLTAPCTFP